MTKTHVFSMAAFLCLLPICSFAQILVSASTPAIQNFNNIGSSASNPLPANWKMSAAGGGLTAGWSSATNVTATTNQAGPGNSPTAGGRYNWGTSVTERALGFMTSSGYASPNAIMAFYQNTAGGTISALHISFSIEQYRANTTAATVTFFFSKDGQNWQAVTDGDVSFAASGGSSYSFSPPVTAIRTFVLSNIQLADNENFYLRWVFATGSSNSQGLGLDDVSVSSNVTYYPRTSATDLSQVSDWTTDINGIGGVSPVNFTSYNQLFHLNNNVANPVVRNAWTISGGPILFLNNSNPLEFTAAASFTVGSGSIADFNHKPVLLRSAASGTAFIGSITGILSNATNVTVERYISSNNNRAYRLLAPSVNTATSIRQHWQEAGSNTPGYGTHITGSTTGANGFDITQTGQPSLFTLNPVTFDYTPVPNTDVALLDAKTGYLLFVRGDRTIDLSSTASPLPSTNTTLRTTGTLLTGEQKFTNLPGDEEFSLVTNPYVAPINWVNVHTASTNLKQFYTFWDPNVSAPTGGYVTIGADGSSSHPGISNATTVIQSGQAFFVQATAGSASAEMKVLETHKSTANNIDVFRIGNHTEIFTSALFYRDQSNNRVNADAASSYFNNNYSAAIDENDASQFPNWNEDVAIGRGDYELSIETRALISARDTIPFVLSRLKVQAYEWQFNAANFNHPDLNAILVDKFLNSRTPISLNGITVIPFAVTSNSASAAADRFMVVFEANNILPVNMTAVKAYQKGKDIQIEWNVPTEVNMEKYEVEKSIDGRLFTKTATHQAKNNGNSVDYAWLDTNPVAGNHYYRIKAIGNTGEAQYSKVMKVSIGKAGYGIAAYPNPLTGNAITLTVNLPKGHYTIRLTNQLGQEIHREAWMHQGGAATQTVQARTELPQGVYLITLSDGNKQYAQSLLKK